MSSSILEKAVQSLVLCKVLSFPLHYVWVSGCHKHLFMQILISISGWARDGAFSVGGIYMLTLLLGDLWPTIARLAVRAYSNT